MAASARRPRAEDGLTPRRELWRAVRRRGAVPHRVAPAPTAFPARRPTSKTYIFSKAYFRNTRKINHPIFIGNKNAK